MLALQQGNPFKLVKCKNPVCENQIEYFSERSRFVPNTFCSMPCAKNAYKAEKERKAYLKKQGIF